MAAFTAQLPNVLSQLGGAVAGPGTTGTGINVSSRATITLGNKPFLDRKASQKNYSVKQSKQTRLGAPGAATAAGLDAAALTARFGWAGNLSATDFQVDRLAEVGKLPHYLQKLTDPDASADFPPANKVNVRSLDNRELDKLVAALGRNKATWRRALQLHEWLLGLGHSPDDRLCTTLMRVCSQHGHALEALNLYEWMRTPKREGGAGLKPSVYTYTGAMRAALVGNLPDRALKVWDEAVKAGCPIDCRMCTTLIEVCTRKGHTERALGMYEMMRDADRGSKLAPSVHAYTAAMRAAAEGGLWQRALDIWQDMEAANCPPSGHAYAAAISACAAGGAWAEAVKLFDNMMGQGIKPDVVSCTALITALAADGQWQQAEALVDWMLRSGVKPNVRTYTALITAMGNARQWSRALATIERMKHSQVASSSVEPNAYTYSALIKAMGEQGEWEMAESVFMALEAEALGEHAAVDRHLSRLAQPLEGEATTDGAAHLHLGALTLADRTASQTSLGEYGQMPTAMAEQVLESNSPKAATLPDSIPGSSTEADSPQSPFSFFSTAAAPAEASEAMAGSHAWTSTNAALSGLPSFARLHRSQATDAVLAVAEERVGVRPIAAHSPLNEVVCGAMLLAYERAGRWEKALRLLRRARELGIEPNNVMFNTAISALGKAGCWEEAERLFAMIPSPDAVSFETMIAAYGLAGETAKAEHFFTIMLEAGHLPRDYAFCGLIAAYSLNGDWRSALGIRLRMQSLGCARSVHVYNALLAVCERYNQWDQALALNRAMNAEGVASNIVTQRLMDSVGKGGITAVESQQVAATALAAAVAAAGSLIMRAGIM